MSCFTELLDKYGYPKAEIHLNEWHYFPGDWHRLRNDPDYKKDRDLMRKRLRLSSQYLAVADLNSALEQCDLVLRSDPYNQQAIALRSRIQRKRQMIIDKEREATRNGMIADVGAAWRPVYAVDSVEADD